MIVAWMLYSLVIGALVVLAATAGEQMALRNRRPTRRVWTLGLAGTVVLPVIGVLLKDAPAAQEVDGFVTAVSPAAGLVMSGVGTLARVDAAMMWLWVGTSALLALVIGGATFADWLRCRSFTRDEIDGVPVLLTDELGPAVTGFARPRILLPRWARESAAQDRHMILRHEQEHVLAGDQRLLAFAALVLIAVPWNAAAWFLTRRLRLAIEVDCDRRVMESDRLDTRSYAELLLAVGSRRARPAYATGFSLGRPFLERRIDRMTENRSESRRSADVLTAVAVVGVLCAAWALPQPVRAADVSPGVDMDCPLENTTTVSQSLIDALLGET